MKLLILYATTEGHTRTICEFLRHEAEKIGYTVKLDDLTINQPSSDDFDTVIIAGSVHLGKYQNALQHYVQKHHKLLNEKKSLFLSVSLTAAADEPESWKELRQQTKEFLTVTGWQPAHIEQVAGALLYTQYNFLKRFLMRMITKRAGGDMDTSKDFVYTNWDQVKRILNTIQSM
ncbi:menaquinone-dependent protoporphyrinogen IX dehydrogenase [Rhodohalobacter sp. SW132]|uniref:menaquinone-dependent protoporphyrinogen IX dehydrogenase n=1 Tax=Rhodohalobacter sp. SW132 TaxID=2293433 RepID=UPI000E262E96|nr:menaquinone-dependent protoporphyrinogen IX dehydrogenase [Rhodohalobacter sp. SW132]REL37755.1 menaquinone-dependent protoporphyrinogen IX dehydrogenase [Rhodohalobacter sp. SW132]